MTEQTKPQVASDLPDIVGPALADFFNSPRQPTTGAQEQAQFEAGFYSVAGLPWIEERIKERKKTPALTHEEISKRDDAIQCLQDEKAEFFRDLEARAAGEAVPPLPVPDPAIVAPCPADHAAEPAWSVNKNKRFTGYNVPLHALLIAAHREGRPRPKAHDVLEAWRICLPPEIAKVLPDGFDYYNNTGNTNNADIPAIREAIRRMTKTR